MHDLVTTDGARLAELDTLLQYTDTERERLTARRQRVAEQLGAGSVRDPKYDGSKRAGLRQELADIDLDLETLTATASEAAAELGGLQQRVAAVDRQHSEARATLAGLAGLFGNDAAFDPDFTPMDPFTALHRRALEAAALLRAAGETVPEQITITMPMGEMRARRPWGGYTHLEEINAVQQPPAAPPRDDDDDDS